jgi:hypothetical protein
MSTVSRELVDAYRPSHVVLSRSLVINNVTFKVDTNNTRTHACCSFYFDLFFQVFVACQTINDAFLFEFMSCNNVRLCTRDCGMFVFRLTGSIMTTNLKTCDKAKKESRRRRTCVTRRETNRFELYRGNITANEMMIAVR